MEFEDSSENSTFMIFGEFGKFWKRANMVCLEVFRKFGERNKCGIFMVFGKFRERGTFGIFEVFGKLWETANSVFARPTFKVMGPSGRLGPSGPNPTFVVVYKFCVLVFRCWLEQKAKRATRFGFDIILNMVLLWFYYGFDIVFMVDLGLNTLFQYGFDVD